MASILWVPIFKLTLSIPPFDQYSQLYSKFKVLGATLSYRFLLMLESGWIANWKTKVGISTSWFRSWLFSSSHFWHSRQTEIICLVTSDYMHAGKAFERTQQTRETIMTIILTISRIIPRDWKALWRHGPHDPKQLKSSRSEEEPAEGVTFLNQVACSVTLCSWVSTSPKVLI